MLTVVFRARTGSGAECRGQQFVDYVVNAAFGDRLGDTAAEVGFQYVPTYPVQSSLHGRELMEDVDAVAVLLHHADHPVDMPTGGAKPELHRVGIGSQLWPSRTRRRSSYSSGSMSPRASRSSSIRSGP